HVADCLGLVGSRRKGTVGSTPRRGRGVPPTAPSWYRRRYPRPLLFSSLLVMYLLTHSHGPFRPRRVEAAGNGIRSAVESAATPFRTVVPKGSDSVAVAGGGGVFARQVVGAVFGLVARGQPAPLANRALVPGAGGSGFEKSSSSPSPGKAGIGASGVR